MAKKKHRKLLKKTRVQRRKLGTELLLPIDNPQHIGGYAGVKLIASG